MRSLEKSKSDHTKADFLSGKKTTSKRACITNTSSGLSFSTEYYSRLLIVNAQNERRGNRTTTKGNEGG